MDTTSEAPDLAQTLTVDRFRRGGVGPLYWSTYGYNNRTNKAMPQAVWEKNLDWVAESLAPFGYKMVCTDGWIDFSQKTTENGYTVGYQEDWTLSWAGMAKDCRYSGSRARDLLQPSLGGHLRYQEPVDHGRWSSGHKDRRHRQPGRHPRRQPQPQLRRRAPGWRRGVCEGVRRVLQDRGAVFLRIDFLAWYEAGWDQSGETTGTAHGRDAISRPSGGSGRRPGT